MRYWLLLFLTLSCPLSFAETNPAGEPRKIFWDALMPKGWAPPEPDIED